MQSITCGGQGKFFFSARAAILPIFPKDSMGICRIQLARFAILSCCPRDFVHIFTKEEISEASKSEETRERKKKRKGDKRETVAVKEEAEKEGKGKGDK